MLDSDNPVKVASEMIDARVSPSARA